MVCGAPMSSVSAAATKTAALQSDLLAYAGLTMASVGWASAFIAGKVVLAEMTPLPVATYRYALATLILFPFAARGGWPTITARTLAPLALMVVCGGVLYQWLFLAALARTSATN